MLFIVDCLFFNSFRSLLNISCIFLIRASSLCIQASILFSRFWTIFTIITMNYFLCRLPICLHVFGLVDFYHALSSAPSFFVFSFCLIYCVWGLLSVGWKDIISLNCRVCPHGWGCTSTLCRFPGLETCLCSVEWSVILSLWRAVPYPVVSFRGIYGFGMALSSLSANVQSYVPILLKVWCGASGTEAYLPLGGTWP